MKPKLLAAAVAAALGAVPFNAGAANLGLDATCAFNGTDQGMVATPEGMRRRCNLPAEIVTTDPIDRTVTLPASVSGANIVWTMPTVVTVGNGHEAGRTPDTAANTVLAINAGARLAGVIRNSAMVITRGARLHALGTATNPIVFSSLDDNYTGAGEWGGLILSSWDDTVACHTTLGDECAMEGISQGTFYYGGYIDEAQTASWDNISSGTVRYVAIAEGGFGIGTDSDGDSDPNSNTGDEINGLTLYGVSSETSIANVHVHNSYDDGIQFFGGDVDIANAWVSCAADDGIEWEYGSRAVLTNLNLLQRDGAGHAFELANGADAAVSNVTLGFTDSTPSVDEPFRFRSGSRGSFSNVEIASAYTASCFYGNSQGALEPGDFSSFEYACTDNLRQLSGSVPVSGFAVGTFWTGCPGNCN